MKPKYKIGTVCMIGSIQRKTVKGELVDKFVSDKGTVLGVCQQSALNKIVESTGDVAAHKKLHDKVVSNVKALHACLKIVATWPEERRLFRIGSNLLPMFDHPVYSKYFDMVPKGSNMTTADMASHLLSLCKSVIDKYNIRVVCHPDQYNIINSQGAETRQRTISSLRMHKWFMERLTTPELGAINIHFSGHLDHIPEINEIQDLIPWLSFENDDTLPHASTLPRAGLDQTLEACERYGVKMCFDMHHYFVETGSWLDIDDPRVERIVATWNGVRPVMHLSQSKMPNGTRPQDLAKHSDRITDKTLIEYSAEFLRIADVEIEAKHKNIAVGEYHSAIEEIFNAEGKEEIAQ